MMLSISSRLILLFAILSFSFIPAHAQEMIKPEVNVAERVRLLESELERQNTKLDQLQKMLEEQQQTIKALLEKLSSQITPEVAAANDNAPIAPAATTTAPAEPQKETVEQRLDKLENQALKIGPVRVSGDFRLRAEGVFRSATEPPDPPLDHVQNTRVRYRLRLNFDADMYPNLKFHAQLATGPLNNPTSMNHDFTSLAVRAPITISEAWIDYRPTKSLQLQAGRVENVFADNTRFLFDNDIRFNGFNEKYVKSFERNDAYVSSLELRAGQYILTNPNIAMIAPNSPLARLGEVIGRSARSAAFFHQGFIVNQTFNERWNSQVGADIQVYRHPNHIQFSSTQEGLVLLIQPGIGIALSGPLSGVGNATTQPGGAIYTAPGFQVARFNYRLNYAGFKRGDHTFPVIFNVQLARNVATGLNERDAMLAALQIGRVTKRADMGFLYFFTIKGANALISQFTDDNVGTGSGVNVRTHHFRFEYGISRKVTFQSLVFIQNSLRRSGQYPNFFVPIGDFAPTQYRLQQQLIFTF